MRALLISNYEPDRQFSMLGFADCLSRELPGAGVETTVIRPDARLGLLAAAPKVRKWLAYFDKYIAFPPKLRRALSAVDVVHLLDHGNAMYVRSILSKPHLVTCHDLLAVRASRGEFAYWHVKPTGRKYQDLIAKGLSMAHGIAAVSEATACDLRETLKIPDSRIKTVLNGVYQPVVPSSREQIEDVLRKYGIDPPYLIAVGNDSPYKNRAGALRIFTHLRTLISPPEPMMVVAGKSADRCPTSELQQLWGKSIKPVETPPSADLLSLVQGAAGLIFPSWNEGFGLPIVEAQMLGVPVFTSNRAPMTEVGGDAAVYFDPADDKGAARTIASHWDRRAQLGQLGMENAKRFGPERMAGDYARIYTEIAGRA